MARGNGHRSLLDGERPARHRHPGSVSRMAACSFASRIAPARSVRNASSRSRPFCCFPAPSPPRMRWFSRSSSDSSFRVCLRAQRFEASSFQSGLVIISILLALELLVWLLGANRRSDERRPAFRERLRSAGRGLAPDDRARHVRNRVVRPADRVVRIVCRTEDRRRPQPFRCGDVPFPIRLPRRLPRSPPHLRRTGAYRADDADVADKTRVVAPSAFHLGASIRRGAARVAEAEGSPPRLRAKRIMGRR